MRAGDDCPINPPPGDMYESELDVRIPPGPFFSKALCARCGAVVRYCDECLESQGGADIVRCLPTRRELDGLVDDTIRRHICRRCPDTQRVEGQL